MQIAMTVFFIMAWVVMIVFGFFMIFTWDADDSQPLAERIVDRILFTALHVTVCIIMPIWIAVC